jgi:hypothetical protein
MDAFTTTRYIIFYGDETFSVCTRSTDADTLLRRHDFYQQCLCTVKQTNMRLKRTSRTANSESTTILDFSPLTPGQVTAAKEGSKASPLAVLKLELIDLSVWILSEQSKKSEVSPEKPTSSGRPETTSNRKLGDENRDELELEMWHETDAATLS